jgi:hypothetical protein
MTVAGLTVRRETGIPKMSDTFFAPLAHVQVERHPAEPKVRDIEFAAKDSTPIGLTSCTFSGL